VWFTKFLYPANERRTHILTFKYPDVHGTRKEEPRNNLSHKEERREF
jgi:hypothetical protein